MGATANDTEADGRARTPAATGRRGMRGPAARPAAAVLGIFVLMAFALLWRTLIGGEVLSSNDFMYFQSPWDSERPPALTRPSNPLMADPVLIMQPDLLVTRRALASGQAPLWDPFEAAGRPLLASQQHAPVFPLNWPALIFGFWHSLAWTAALKLLLAALGMYLLTRWMGLPRGPCLLAGTAFAFCAYTFSWVQYPLDTSVALTPWVMLTAGRLARLGRPLDVLALALAVGLILVGGHPETAAIGLLCAAAFALFELVRSRRDAAAPRPPIRLGLLAAGGALGLGLGAVMLLPLAEFLGVASSTTRGAPAPPHSVIYSFFFPELWGRPDKALDFGPVNYSERTAYAGALPLLLAGGGIFARRPRGVHVFWLVLGIVAFGVSMDTPLLSLVNEIPGAKTINLNRVLFVVALAVAVLAALGLQAWLEADRRGRLRMLAAIGVLGLVPVVVLLRHEGPFSHLGAALSQLPAIGRDETRKEIFKQAVAWRWIVFGGAGVALLLLTRRVPPRVAVLLAVAVVAVDLLTLDNGYVPAVPAQVANPPIPPAIGFLQANAGHQRVSGMFATPPAPPGLSLSPNLAERYGLSDPQAYDLPVVARQSKLWGGYGSPADNYNPFYFESPRAHAAMDTFAVRYLIAPTGQRGPDWLRPVATHGADLVLENPTALPRAWVAYDWRNAHRESDALGATLASSTLALYRTPVLEGASGAAGPGAAGTNPSPARFQTDSNERVVLRADATRPGYLILEDTYYPGWGARVDGHSTPILAANGAFRAVAIPAGSHTVTFTYRPASAVAGAAISIACAAGMLAALVALLLRRRRRTGGA